MTTLQTCTINSVSIKTYVKEFVIKKKIFYPDNCTITCVKGAVDSVVVPATNHAVSITYNDSIGTYTIFTGKVVKVTTQGHYYKIDCISSLTKAFDFLITKNWTAGTNHDTIMDDILNDATIGVDSTITVTNTVGYHTTLTNYNVTNQPAIDQLRKLCFYSRNGTGDPFTVFYQDSTASNTIVLADYGDTTPSSTITLAHSTGKLLSPLTYDDTSKEIINQVTVRYRGGSHTSADGDSGGYSTSNSRTAFGTRNLPIYRPEIDNVTDAIATEATYLRQYSAENASPSTVTLKRYSVDVKHSALHGNATHYPVINTKYTISDGVGGGYFADQVCTEHTIRWPSFKDTLKFGYPTPYDGDQVLTDLTKRVDAIERDSAGLNVSFKVYRNATQSINSSSTTQVNFDAEVWDEGSNYDSSSGYTFTAPIRGYYFFASNLAMSIENTKYLEMRLTHNSTWRYDNEVINSTGATNRMHVNIAGTVKMAAGDTVFISVRHNNSVATNIDNSEVYCNFSGFLISTY